jgi:tetratricopeptide (TPR) repeat protein
MDTEEALGLILDELMDWVGPDVAEAIRLCAIPRWFGEEIVAWLRGEEEPSEHTRKILAALTDLTFVKSYDQRGWACHKVIRDLVLKRWCREDKERFRELSLRMADYYADKKQDKQEFIYHLLVGGDARGFELLEQAISQANRLFQFSTAERLINLTREPCIALSQKQRWCLQYYTGELAAISGRWDEALPVLDSLQKQDLPQPLRAKVLARLGTVYNRTGRWEKSVEFYQRSLKIEEQVDPNIRAWTYTGLGILYKRRGEWKLAKGCQENAIRVAEQSGNLLWLGRALNNLGEVHQLEGQSDQARSLYHRSIDIKKQLDDKYGLIWTYINLGTLHIDQEDWRQASRFLRQGLELARNLASSPEEAWALEYLGELHRRQGHYDLAAQRYIQGLAICEEINDVYKRARIQARLGSLYEDRRDYAGALTYLEKALETFKRLKSYEASQAEKDVQRVRSQLERGEK